MKLSRELQYAIDFRAQQREAARAKAKHMRSLGIEWPPAPYRNPFEVEWPRQPDKKNC